MALLLQNGKQQFIDGNGIPLANGTVAFYIPNTSTPKTTWQDHGESILNINPVPLDASGEAIIYGNGQYRQVVKDSLGNTVWDQLTDSVVSDAIYQFVSASSLSSARSALGLGTAAVENLSAVIIDNGAGALTIGAGQVTGAMIQSSAALAGAPTTTTAAFGDKTTKIATTAYAQSCSAPIGSFSKLSTNVVSNTQTGITVNDLILGDSSGDALRISGISSTNDISVSGAGGLDTGTVANSTWYSLWVIYNPTTLTVSTLASTSTTSPSLPSGYTFKARVGWARSDSSAHLMRTLQYGRKVQYVIGSNPSVLPVMATSPATVWTAVAIGNFVPPTAMRISIASCCTQAVSSNLYIAPNSSYNTTPSASNLIPVGFTGGSSAGGFCYTEMILESTNIYWGANASAGASSIGCFGWEDNL